MLIHLLHLLNKYNDIILNWTNMNQEKKKHLINYTDQNLAMQHFTSVIASLKFFLCLLCGSSGCGWLFAKKSKSTPTEIGKSKTVSVVEVVTFESCWYSEKGKS